MISYCCYKYYSHLHWNHVRVFTTSIFITDSPIIRKEEAPLFFILPWLPWRFHCHYLDKHRSHPDFSLFFVNDTTKRLWRYYLLSLSSSSFCTIPLITFVILFILIIVLIIRLIGVFISVDTRSLSQHRFLCYHIKIN